MIIEITGEAEKIIQQKVKAGYNDPVNVVTSALELLRGTEEMQSFDSYKKYVNDAIEKGLDDVRNGRIVTAEELKKTISNIRKKYE
jgi:hypothetical protein